MHDFCSSKLTKDDFEVVVGEYDLDKVGDEQGHHDVKEIILHPNYNESTFEYDFAILKLVIPVTISEKVAIISLIDESQPDLNAKTVILFGWGLNEKDMISSKLKSIEMEVFSNLVCKNSFKTSKINVTLSNNHICALTKNDGSATCRGDSGGINCTSLKFPLSAS